MGQGHATAARFDDCLAPPPCAVNQPKGKKCLLGVFEGPYAYSSLLIVKYIDKKSPDNNLISNLH